MIICIAIDGMTSELVVSTELLLQFVYLSSSSIVLDKDFPKDLQNKNLRPKRSILLSQLINGILFDVNFIVDSNQSENYQKIIESHD